MRSEVATSLAPADGIGLVAVAVPAPQTWHTRPSPTVVSTGGRETFRA